MNIEEIEKKLKKWISKEILFDKEEIDKFFPLKGYALVKTEQRKICKYCGDDFQIEFSEQQHCIVPNCISRHYFCVLLDSMNRIKREEIKPLKDAK